MRKSPSSLYNLLLLPTSSCATAAPVGYTTLSITLRYFWSKRRQPTRYITHSSFLNRLALRPFPMPCVYIFYAKTFRAAEKIFHDKLYIPRAYFSFTSWSTIAAKVDLVANRFPANRPSPPNLAPHLRYQFDRYTGQKISHNRLKYHGSSSGSTSRPREREKLCRDIYLSMYTLLRCVHIQRPTTTAIRSLSQRMLINTVINSSPSDVYREYNTAPRPVVYTCKQASKEIEHVRAWITYVRVCVCERVYARSEEFETCAQALHTLGSSGAEMYERKKKKMSRCGRDAVRCDACHRSYRCVVYTTLYRSSSSRDLRLCSSYADHIPLPARMSDSCSSHQRRRRLFVIYARAELGEVFNVPRLYVGYLLFVESYRRSNEKKNSNGSGRDIKRRAEKKEKKIIITIMRLKRVIRLLIYTYTHLYRYARIAHQPERVQQRRGSFVMGSISAFVYNYRCTWQQQQQQQQQHRMRERERETMLFLRGHIFHRALIASTISRGGVSPHASREQAMIVWKEQQDISKILELQSFLRVKGKGHKPKKSLVFTSEDISKFLNDASDDQFLLHKLAFGSRKHFQIYTARLRLAKTLQYLYSSPSARQNSNVNLMKIGNWARCYFILNVCVDACMPSGIRATDTVLDRTAWRCSAPPPPVSCCCCRDRCRGCCWEQQLPAADLAGPTSRARGAKTEENFLPRVGEAPRAARVSPSTPRSSSVPPSLAAGVILSPLQFAGSSTNH
ncbi:unnamed protein product [Trichogramma brassicae]|uniref:Uncharacterized protein n=1 Tax=Trichogramma brassicae TaxID=86971 RepID=A0A6H5I7T7_9HYME|nr:unnamed protein product [Trichogramma brassicae]